jgi:hypothetical protein
MLGGISQQDWLHKGLRELQMRARAVLFEIALSEAISMIFT